MAVQPVSRLNYKITIPMTPQSINFLMRLHWSKYQKIKEEWHTAVWVLCREAHIPVMDKANVEVKVYFRDSRKRDLPNYIVSLDKLVLDGLVRCGILPDDTPEQIPSFVVNLEVDRQNPRTEIILKSLDIESTTGV